MTKSVDDYRALIYITDSKPVVSTNNGSIMLASRIMAEYDCCVTKKIPIYDGIIQGLKKPIHSAMCATIPFDCDNGDKTKRILILIIDKDDDPDQLEWELNIVRRGIIQRAIELMSKPDDIKDDNVKEFQKETTRSLMAFNTLIGRLSGRDVEKRIIELWMSKP